MAILIFFGAIGILTIPWFIQTYRKKAQLEQQIQNFHGKQDEQLILQERFEQLSKNHQQTEIHISSLETKLQQATQQLAGVEQSLSHKNELLEKNEAEKDALHNLVEEFRQSNNTLNTHVTKLKTEHEQMQQNNAEKLALLDDAKMKLSQEFKLLANQIFEEKQSKMTEHNKATLDDIIQPMQKEMTDFKSRMEQVHKEDTEARSSLERHLEHLKTLNQQMSQDALNLTQALKSDSKVQGNWGELILERILESSGLREGHEFHRERSFKDDEGNRQRPDVIINMPGNKHIIIDAKVSLTDYERAVSSTDKHEKELHIKAHVKSLQKHIQTLADKRYDHIHEINSPDYVLMFVPIEGAYLMAIEADSSIFEAAFDKNIAVVTPSTLYATLKLVEQLWRYEKQSGNVAKLTKQAGSLHDKFVTFIKSFEDIETHLGRAQKSYDNALNQLKNGRGNLVNQVKTLADLSGKAKKEIPEHFLEDSSPALPEGK